MSADDLNIPQKIQILRPMHNGMFLMLSLSVLCALRRNLQSKFDSQIASRKDFSERKSVALTSKKGRKNAALTVCKQAN